jgi:hypothetical protein
LIFDDSGRLFDLETTTTSWADELGDSQSYTKKEKVAKKEKRFSSGFHKRSEDVSMLEKWDHDKYNSQSEEETSSRPRSQKNKSKKVF